MDRPPEKVGAADPGIAAYYQSIGIETLKLMGLGSILHILWHTVYYALRLAGKRRDQTSKPA